MALGLFITLYDENTLRLYLSKGVYGFLMAPTRGEIGSRSRHFHALADFSCVREGTEVFFFQNRRLFYGGQVIGFPDFGSFILNGGHSPLGQQAEAPICWDETKREGYIQTKDEGILMIRDRYEAGEKTQPYLIRFVDKKGFSDRYISTDSLYWRLGDFSYPLPSNSIQDMGFCTLTPGETRIILELLQNNPDGFFSKQSSENIELSKNYCIFTPNLGIQNLSEAFEKNLFVNEAHLEATVLANPRLLPTIIQPQISDVLCRQVPISPFKPAQMDRADICYYSEENPIYKGTIPNVIIELKNKTALQQSVAQVQRYLDWIYRIVASEIAKKIKVYVFAPNFSPRVIIEKYHNQIMLITPRDINSSQKVNFDF